MVDVAPEYRMEEIEVASGCAGEGQPIADVRGGAIIVGVRFAEGNFQPQPPAETVLNAGDVVMAMGTLRTMQRLEAPLRARALGVPAVTPVSDLRAAVEAAAAALANGGATKSQPTLERPKQADHGDYATNAALVLAPLLKAPPREVAEQLGGALRDRLGDALERVEVAGPGFLNLFLADPWYVGALDWVLAAGEGYGGGGASPALRVNVEFVSANPTGPLTAASGRHAAYGDALARVLQFAGHEVVREYYFNDAGTQIEKLGESIRARARGEEIPEGGYEGDYVRDLAAEIPGAAEMDADELARIGVELMFDRIKATLRAYRVDFDVFFSERALHEGTPSAVERGIERLSEQGHLYRSDGALWLRTSEFGDDKDRVLERSTGQPTYFAADVAYAENKLERGFDLLVIPLGSDHHGYVARLKANMAALGAGAERLEIPILQFVHIVEGGARASMSKRRGEFITLDDLHRRDRRRRRALLHALALQRLDDRPRPRPRAPAVGREPRLLRPVRARADRVGAAQGGGGARGARPGGHRPGRRAAPVRARTGQEAARLPRGGRRGRGAPRTAPHRGLRARPRPGLHRLLPRLPGGRGRARRARGLAPAPVGRHAADDRPRARPARRRGPRRDVSCRARRACAPGR